MMWAGELCRLGFGNAFLDGTYIEDFDWPVPSHIVPVKNEAGIVIGRVSDLWIEDVDGELTDLAGTGSTVMCLLDLDDGLSVDSMFVRPHLIDVSYGYAVEDETMRTITDARLGLVNVSLNQLSGQGCRVMPLAVERVVPPTQAEMHEAEDEMAEQMMRYMNQEAGANDWRDADAYQRQCKTTAKVATTDLWYFGLGLAGEAGEVADKIKKFYRDHEGTMTDEYRDSVVAELGDTAWYLSMIAESLGVDLSSVFAANVAKLKDRHERNVLHGEGDNR